MAKKRNSAFLSKLAMGLIFVIAVVYAIYHLMSLFSGDGIKTIEAGVTTHTVTVGGSGYIFRDEVLLTADKTGVVDYEVSDGARVSTGQKVAAVYQGEGQLREMVTALDRQIEVLEKSTLGTEPLNMATLRAEANNTYYKLMELLSSGEAGQLSAQIENITVALNRMSAMTDDEEAVSKTLASMKKMREDMFVGEYDTGYAPSSGYFYYTADGYENIFTSAAVEALNEESFYSMISTLDTRSSNVSERVFGKIADSSGWRFVVPLSPKDAAALELENTFNLSFPENNSTTLPMTLEKKVEANEHKQVLCVFYCNRLPENFSLERCQSVKIEVSSAKGIYVPRSAIASLDGVRGVYVLRGSVIHFRCVEIVYQGVDYCLVAENAVEQQEYAPLGVNELIIYEGKNLFDGRILE